MNDDDIKNRFKKTHWFKEKESDDLFRVWAAQKRMQAQDKKIEAEIKAAKKRAKALKKALKKHRFGEQGKATRQISRAYGSVKGQASKLAPKRFPAISRSKKPLAGAAAIVVVAGISLYLFGNATPPQNTTTGTLGETSGNPIATQDVIRETPVFDLLFPAGSNEELFDVARTSAPGAAASYTYLDRFEPEGAIFRVTQQEIPDEFDLAKVAAAFQATNVIQLDDTPIYHGYSERGGVQSLIFLKANRLISIRSPQKFSDDQWVTYVLSLR
jgi:hypothetical protein